MKFPQPSQKTKSLSNAKQVQIELNADGSAEFEYNGLLLMILFQSADILTTKLKRPSHETNFCHYYLQPFTLSQFSASLDSRAGQKLLEVSMTSRDKQTR